MPLACAACFIVGAALGAFAASARLGRELGRIAAFLRKRDRAGSARINVELPGRGLRELAQAVNGELDAAQSERIEALRRSDELQRGLSSLSHDIRTPLMGAKGRLQIAAGERDDVARNAHLDAAARRLDDVEALLDQLFAYARANDPDAPLAVERIEVLPVLEHVLAGQYAAFEQAGMEPALDVENPALVVDADRGALARIFENIVVNALRHGCGPTLDIGLSNESASFSNRVEHPDVIDSARMFDRFYRADAARAGGGSGIGLAIVSKLCKRMGFSVEARIDGDTLTVTVQFS